MSPQLIEFRTIMCQNGHSSATLNTIVCYPRAAVVNYKLMLHLFIVNNNNPR